MEKKEPKDLPVAQDRKENQEYLEQKDLRDVMVNLAQREPKEIKALLVMKALLVNKDPEGSRENREILERKGSLESLGDGVKKVTEERKDQPVIQVPRENQVSKVK